MRLDFNVLWVDDQPDELKAQREAIAKEMAAHGFQFEPAICSGINQVRTLITDNVFQDQVDLILVDWDLEGGLKGQDVIAEIRDEIRYKDVIFYSSLTNPAELREHAFSAGAEGVFCASKGNIVTEVIEVFETLVKKVLDLDHTRGIVMGATSDIDAMVVECLAKIDGGATDSEKQALLDKAKKLVEASLARVQKNIATLQGATGVTAMLEAHGVFTANDRLRVLDTILKANKYDDHSTLRTGLKDYITNVVPRRNDLGHIVLVPEGATEMIDAQGKHVSLEEMRELRRFLLELRSDFRKLRDGFLAP